MPNPPSVRRAKDRATMARVLTTALQASGATCSEEMRGAREIVLEIFAPGGARCSVHFDGNSAQPGVWVCTWNLCGSRRFAAWPSAEVNQHHHQKATRVFYSFLRMVDGLCADVERFVDGSAYLENGKGRP